MEHLSGASSGVECNSIVPYLLIRIKTLHHDKNIFGRWSSSDSGWTESLVAHYYGKWNSGRSVIRQTSDWKNKNNRMWYCNHGSLDAQGYNGVKAT